MNSAFNYGFPAVKGMQAGRECYIATVPMEIVPKLFPYPPPTKNLKARYRAQRTLTPARVKKLVRYILDNPESYIIPAITVVINSAVEFEEIEESEGLEQLGVLKFPVSAKVNVVDGQHRCTAISEVVSYNDDFSDETIGVMFFVNRDLNALQQMFADLNRHASKPTKSIGILYEHRELRPRITKEVIEGVVAFNGFVDEEKNTLTKTSGKLFTINAIYDATTMHLLKIPAKCEEETEKQLIRRAVKFWNFVDELIPQWRAVRENMLSPSEVRDDFIHTQSVALCAIGRVGNKLIIDYPEDWKSILSRMKDLNWLRTNRNWEGRCIVHSQLKKGRENIVLVANAIKKHIGEALDEYEKSLEYNINNGQE